MEKVAEMIGWIFIVSFGLVLVMVLLGGIGYLFRKGKSPQIGGAELPETDARMDLNKRYDVVYGAGYGASPEKLVGVRIVGYLRSDREETTGEYMSSRWLVVELPDTRRAYLRPQSILWMMEASPTE